MSRQFKSWVIGIRIGVYLWSVIVVQLEGDATLCNPVSWKRRKMAGRRTIVVSRETFEIESTFPMLILHFNY